MLYGGFFSSETFHIIFDVWYLLELSDHNGAEVPDGVILDWSFRSCLVYAREFE